MSNSSHNNIKVLGDRLSAFFNVKLKNAAILSTGNVDLPADDKKIFFDEQFKIIMKKIKEVRS